MTERETLQELGERITRERVYAELTQQQLADKAAISLNTLSKAERGYPMTTSTLYRILDALKAERQVCDVLPEPVVNPILLRKAKKERKRVR